MGRFFFYDLRTIAIQIVHVSCVFCLCCGSQFEGHFLNEKKLTARCNTSVCGQTMDPKLGPNIGFKFGATCGLKMRPRSVSRGPILGSIMRPRFGVRFSFSLSVAPKWGPKSDPHYGSIFLAGVVGSGLVKTSTTCRHRFDQKWTQKWRPD